MPAGELPQQTEHKMRSDEAGRARHQDRPMIQFNRSFHYSASLHKPGSC